MSILEGAPIALPSGYHARAFEDGDREPLVAARNAEVHPMERGDANEWRHWESIAKDDSLLRITVVAPDGSVAATADIGTGMMPREDGSHFVSVGVVSAHRGHGIGSALLAAVEDEARRRRSPRVLSGASAAQPFAVDWASRRGYREIGRRIGSYVDLSAFDPAAFGDTLERVRGSGIRLRTIADVLAEIDEKGRERFWRELYEAEAPMWDDIPFATPTPHWSWDRFRAAVVDSGQIILDVSIVAYDGSTIAGFSTNGRRAPSDGWTWMTGTARDHRGKGIALALKVEALTRAKDAGLRAMGTTNDEPNKAMRGINAKLGYQMLPARIELEKVL